MPEIPPAPAPVHDPHDRSLEAPREGTIMALYLCLVLGAEFMTVDDSVHAVRSAIELIWSTTLGLAIAHLFTFGLVSHIFSGHHMNRETALAMLWQFGAAVVIATALTVPFAFLDVSKAFDADALMIAFVFGLTVFVAARAVGVGTSRAVVDGAITLAMGVVVVVAKVALTH